MSWVTCRRGGAVELPAISMVTEAEFLQAAAQERHEEPDDEARAAAWNHGLAQFGLAPPSYDGEAQRNDMVSDTTAAYFPKERAIRIIDRAEALDDDAAVVTLAHEFVHALQDRELQLADYLRDHASTFDAGLAATAIIEGEAVHYQVLAAIDLAGRQPKELRWEDFYRKFATETQQSADKDSAPYAMARLRFPYAFGGSLISQAWLKRGRAGIDAVFDQPPTSTHEVLFGESDFDGDVMEVRSQGLPRLSDSFEPRGFATLGAWMARMYGARLNVPVADRWRHARALRADAFTVQVDIATGQSIAAWHVRTVPNASPAAWPGTEQLAFVSTWIPNAMGSDVFFVSADPGVPPRAEFLEWNDVESMPQPSAASAAVLPPDGVLFGHALVCAASVPDLGAFFEESQP
jgi:hypothetical protein